MTASAPVHIFIDANTALHFKRPDQIDWCALTGTNTVILVGAPILHRELEYQKVHNPSRKLRERANTYIKWLAEFVRNPGLPVRTDTSWHFIPLEPQIDFASLSLSPTISDDHLIASVIAYAQTRSDPIFVATADVGLEVKLRYRRIAPLLLPEDVRLPDEPDPQEKELLSLRRQLAQQRAPILRLVTDTEGGRHPIREIKQITKPSAPSLREVRSKNPLLPDEKSNPTTGSKSLAQLVMASSFENIWLTPERIQSYNIELNGFFREYETYLNDLLQWEQLAALSDEIQLSLSNEGTAPASDIDVILHFPDDIILMTSDSLPAEPEQPALPKRPQMMFGAGMSQASFANLLAPRYPDFPMPEVEGPTSVCVKDHRLTFWLRNLKHGVTEQLESVFFRFPDRQAVRSFGVDYTISAAELPQAISGKLHFVLPDGNT